MLLRDLSTAMSSLTINYKAKAGDTVSSIATAVSSPGLLVVTRPVASLEIAYV